MKHDHKAAARQIQNVTNFYETNNHNFFNKQKAWKKKGDGEENCQDYKRITTHINQSNAWTLFGF